MGGFLPRVIWSFGRPAEQEGFNDTDDDDLSLGSFGHP